MSSPMKFVCPFCRAVVFAVSFLIRPHLTVECQEVTLNQWLLVTSNVWGLKKGSWIESPWLCFIAVKGGVCDSKRGNISQERGCWGYLMKRSLGSPFYQSHMESYSWMKTENHERFKYQFC